MWWILWVFLGLVGFYLLSELFASIGEAKVWSWILKSETMSIVEINDVVEELYKGTLAGNIRAKIIIFYTKLYYWLLWSD